MNYQEEINIFDITCDLSKIIRDSSAFDIQSHKIVRAISAKIKNNTLDKKYITQWSLEHLV